MRTDLDKEYQDATLQLEMDMTNFADQKAACSIEVQLLDDRRQPVAESQVDAISIQPRSHREVHTARVTVPNPAKWTAETPNLYTLVLTLKNAAGRDAGGLQPQARLSQSGDS